MVHHQTAGAHWLDFLLGLPVLADNALWRTARHLQAPVLISANALSRWKIGSSGVRCWTGFDTRNLRLVRDHPVALDSAGFVAAARYNGFPWCVDEYLDLCAAAPRRWFASQDRCVEPEIARDEEAVRDRISGTVRLNVLCRNGADERGIADRFVPVIQGWEAEQYLRCLDRMPFAPDYPLVGVGSMCCRHIGGDHGILRVIDELDRSFDGSNTRLHLFGLKSQGMEAVRGHPRVASVDSQAWGIEGRQQARKARRGKSNAFLATAMASWYERQHARLDIPNYVFTTPVHAIAPKESPSLNPIEARIADAAEELRQLHERGEIEWTDVSALAVYEAAFM